MAARRYSDEEVRDILKRAIDMEVDQNGFTREQLVDLADELDISRDALHRAEAAWTSEHVPPAPRETPVRPETPVRERDEHEGRDGFTFPVGKLIFFLVMMSIFGGWSGSWLLVFFLFTMMFAAGRTGRHGHGGWACGPYSSSRHRHRREENWL